MFFQVKAGPRSTLMLMWMEAHSAGDPMQISKSPAMIWQNAALIWQNRAMIWQLLQGWVWTLQRDCSKDCRELQVLFQAIAIWVWHTILFLGPCVRGRRALATRAPNSTGWSQSSCSRSVRQGPDVDVFLFEWIIYTNHCREETSQGVMAQGASPSTETSSMMKTLPRSMTRYCPTLQKSSVLNCR